MLDKKLQWRKYEFVDQKLFISLPENWFVFDLNMELEPFIERFINKRTLEIPELAENKENIINFLFSSMSELKNKGGQLSALTGTIDNGEVVALDFNLSIVDTTGEIENDLALKTLKEKIESDLKQGQLPYHIADAILPGGKAIEVRKVIPLLVSEDIAAFVGSVQFYIPVPECRIIILTFSCSNLSKMSTYYPLIRAIAVTFGVVENNSCLRKDLNSSKFL